LSESRRISAHVGHIPERDELTGLDAASQLVWLAAFGNDLCEYVTRNHTAAFLHTTRFGKRGEFPKVVDRDWVLGEVRGAWSDAFSEVPLAPS
jgi:hypothetical protein